MQDPYASLLFPMEPLYASSNSPSSGASLSPPTSVHSLDFSHHSLAPSPESDGQGWEATLNQMIREDQARKSASPPALGQQSWPAASKQLPYSFGQARIAGSLPTSSVYGELGMGLGDFDMEPDSYDYLAGLPSPSTYGYGAKRTPIFGSTFSPPPAASVAPAIVNSQAYATPEQGISLGAILGTSTAANTPTSRSSQSPPAHVSPPTVQPAALSAQANKPFAVRVPSSQKSGNSAPSISVHSAEEDDKPSKPSSNKRKASAAGEELEGHNAVERRYRTKINSYIVSLQSLVPALAHLVDPPDMEKTHRRKTSAFVLSSQPAIPAGTIIDGVAAAGKLSKGIVLEKSLDYVRHLRRERERLQKEREITHAVLSELVDGSELLLQEAARRYEIASAALDERYHLEDIAFEREMEGGGPTATAAGARPRKAAKTGAGNKRGRKAADSDDSDDDDDGMLGVGRARGGARHSTSPDTAHEAITPPGPPRAMLAVFAGVSFAGGLGYDIINSSAETATDAATAAWSPRELVKRAFVADKTGVTATGTSGSSALLFLGIASIVGWLIYLSWPVLEAMLGHRRALQMRRRHAAVMALNSAGKPGEGELARARRSREALTTLARIPKRTLGSFFAIVWDSLLGLVGIRSRGFGSALTEDERTEIALALVRLAELESAKPDGLCCLTQRIYTFVRLHNLSHSPRWPVQSSPALAPARVEATLALVLTSIFGPQASAMSRRRRLWNNAVAEPQKKRDDGEIEPWVAVALGADFEEATLSQVRGPICGSLSSPSDILPLLRVAEARCEKALLNVWTALFATVMQTTCNKRSQAQAVLASQDLESRVDLIARATVIGSPLHTLTVLTYGLINLGKGDNDGARTIAMQFALEAKDGGPAGGLASVAAFTRLLLGDTVGLFMHAGEPAGPLDTLAAASVRWLIIRGRAAKSSTGVKVDKDLHDATRELRTLLAQDVFRREGLSEALLTCVDALERLGRRAAGLQELDEHDSGFESE